MKFSIIIPSFNQGRFIGRTLESIIQQEGPEAQILVSDGGSTDETVEVLRSYGDRITWWSERDRGFADAVNKALPRITGEVVAIQSSDDYYLPGAFLNVAREFRRTGATLVSGGFVGIDLNYQIKNVAREKGWIDPRRFLREGAGIPQHATFIRTEAFQALGGVREEVDMCADFDLWCRALLRFPGVSFPEIIAVYQYHPNQRTATARSWLSSFMATYDFLATESPYREGFTLSDADRGQLHDYWAVTWGRNTRDPLAPELARAALARSRRYRLPIRAVIASAAVCDEPDRSKRLWFYFRRGQVAPFLWNRVEEVSRRWAIRRTRVNLRWVEKVNAG